MKQVCRFYHNQRWKSDDEKACGGLPSCVNYSMTVPGSGKHYKLNTPMDQRNYLQNNLLQFKWRCTVVMKKSTAIQKNRTWALNWIKICWQSNVCVLIPWSVLVSQNSTKAKLCFLHKVTHSWPTFMYKTSFLFAQQKWLIYMYGNLCFGLRRLIKFDLLVCKV